MPPTITESVVEQATLDWFKELGYAVAFGPDIAPDEPAAERATFGDVVLVERLRAALARINPTLPADALEEVARKVVNAGHASPSLFENNRRFHRLLVEGVDVEYSACDGRIVHDKAWLVDWQDKPGKNDWLVVNQFTVIEERSFPAEPAKASTPGNTSESRLQPKASTPAAISESRLQPERYNNRRPDVVVFINGLPLGVIELKNPADENATLTGAFKQLQTYKHDIPSLFPYNELLIISDGVYARVGTLTADWERFMPWRTIEGDTVAPKGSLELEVLVKGVCHKSRLLDLIQNFIVFETDADRLVKKMAGYHQFHAVNKAVESTVRAASLRGDRRVGVVWHTQGSGKSLTMAFYAGKIIRHPAMENPTIVVLTDRNDLDDQLFGTFAACQDLIRQTPVQAESRENLRELLRVASGGVVFTTIQKFAPERGDTYPLLSERRNIVFVADEAHRSQYGFGAHVIKREDAAYIAYGFAKYVRDALPNASFIGFTGTPVEATDRSTPAVFGDYIDVYDIQRAVEDGATVRIYYEGRLAKLELREDERPRIDPEFEEVTEGEEVEVKEQLKTRWARLEAMVGSDKRIALVARDIVEHWEHRLEAIDGKGMIVCMSRRICVALYGEIIKLRPDWHHADDDEGVLKVVMTGSAADDLGWQPHIRNKPRRKAMAERFKNSDDPLRLVIVRDMWLTGFDLPCLHTMYLDKPMRGHGLMQAIARVNRVFRDKQGGLVVDYLGLADQLKRALADYTEGDRGQTGIPQEEAVAVLLEKHEVVAGLFHAFDTTRFFTGAPQERLAVIPAAMQHILEQDPAEGKKRYVQAVTELSQAFALAVPHERALALRDEVGFFQAVRAAFVKAMPEDGRTPEDLDTAVRQLVSRAVASDKVIDIFAAAGLKTPDISILSDEFLAEIQGLPHKNLALELLRKLINDEIRSLSRKNLVQARSFAEMLENAIRQYQNRSLETAQVIAELIELAKEMRAAHQRGEQLGLTEDELAFYDALEVNDSAVKVLGDETLRTIARESVETVRRNTTIDWTVRESVRAKLRTLVKRILRKYGYPPDKQEKATLTVIAQAELIAKDWVG